jgi:hypothetical protein
MVFYYIYYKREFQVFGGTKSTEFERGDSGKQQPSDEGNKQGAHHCAPCNMYRVYVRV